jgi:hypothetical protein
LPRAAAIYFVNESRESGFDHLAQWLCLGRQTKSRPSRNRRIVESRDQYVAAHFRPQFHLSRLDCGQS